MNSGPDGAEWGCPALGVWKVSMRKLHLTRDPQVRKGQGSLHTEWQREPQKASRTWGLPDVGAPRTW